MPSSMDNGTTAALHLKQKIKRNKLAAFYRQLNVMGNLDLINLDQFKLAMDFKKKYNIRVLQW